MTIDGLNITEEISRKGRKHKQKLVKNETLKKSFLFNNITWKLQSLNDCSQHALRNNSCWFIEYIGNTQPHCRTNKAGARTKKIQKLQNDQFF